MRSVNHRALSFPPGGGARDLGIVRGMKRYLLRTLWNVTVPYVLLFGAAAVIGAVVWVVQR